MLYNVLFVKIGSKLLEMFAVEKGKGENTIAIDRAQLGDRCAFLFYARVSSSEWELFGHIARSAFRRTPSGREVVA